MRLIDILQGVDYELIQGDIEKEVENFHYDSRKVNESGMFVALQGTVSDGHNYIPKVLEKGCSTIVVEKDAEFPFFEHITIVKVKNGRMALSQMSQNFFDNPLKKMKSIAITGTKGKSTVSYMIKDILENASKKCGVIGTIGIYIDGEITQTENTTPESYELNEAFDKMFRNGCEYVVMEVSSQAIKMNRVYGLSFDVGIFTNLSKDHIGPNEHKDFSEYLSCKAKVFDMCKLGIFNKDDKNFDEISKNASCEIRTFGVANADYKIGSIEHENIDGKLSMSFSIACDTNSTSAKNDIAGNYVVGLPGFFNVYNAACSAIACVELGIATKPLSDALKSVFVKGRVENVPTGRDFSVIIDFAHNGVSTESVLKTLRGYEPKRLVAIFGCGGNRSKVRRYEMGEAVGKYADYAIVTSDNSRNEAVEDIVADIRTGIDKTDIEYTILTDRKEAIDYAIDNACSGDMIVILGKGHEEYQEINGKRYHFSDREAVEASLERL